MKKLCIVLMLTFCAVPLFANQDIVDLILQMDETLLLGYLEDIVSFGPRVTYSPECEAAAQYIYDQFVSMGLDVRFHNYLGDTVNVEATLHDSDGTDDAIFVVCAHYDTVPYSPGADNDGSGTAVVLAMAELLSSHEFNCTIRFVTFSGSEQGNWGSNYYVDEVMANDENIVGVLNVDMIGYANTAYESSQINAYYGTLSAWLVNYVHTVVAPRYYDYIGLEVNPIIPKAAEWWESDTISWWENDFHGIWFREHKLNIYKYTPLDVIDNMNIDYFINCSRLVLATMAELSGGFGPLPLEADSHTLSIREGGTINFTLNAGLDNANRNYVLLAGASSISPGSPLPGNLIYLPLNWDAITTLVLKNLNSYFFTDFKGTLDANGVGHAQLNLPGDLPATALGVLVNFSYACGGPWDYVSWNPVGVKFVQ